jgi:hypothetical protein
MREKECIMRETLLSIAMALLVTSTAHAERTEVERSGFPRPTVEDFVAKGVDGFREE